MENQLQGIFRDCSLTAWKNILAFWKKELFIETVSTAQ